MSEDVKYIFCIFLLFRFLLNKKRTHCNPDDLKIKCYDVLTFKYDLGYKEVKSKMQVFYMKS